MRKVFHDPRADSLWISQLTPLEMRSLVHIALRIGHLTEAQRQSILEAFRGHLRVRLQVLSFEPEHFLTAEELIDRHGLRPADALQLASALAIGESRMATPVVFVCSDRPLADAAQREGLLVLDPTQNDEAP